MDYLLARLNISSSYKTGAKVLGNTSRARPICLPMEEFYGLGSLLRYIISGRRDSRLSIDSLPKRVVTPGTHWAQLMNKTDQQSS